MRVKLMIATTLVAAALTPAWAGDVHIAAETLLHKLPNLPTDAQGAYTLFLDQGQGAVTPGPVFTDVERELTEALQGREEGEDGAEEQAQAQRQMDMAERMKSEYGTPEGQAKLRNMSPAQLMAFAQQMQGMAGTPQGHVISPHDQEASRHITIYEGQAEVLNNALQVQLKMNTLQAAWEAEAQALDQQEAAAIKALPVCPGEASIPSSAAMRDAKLDFAHRRESLAGQYLGKYAPDLHELIQILQPEIEHAAHVHHAWVSLEDRDTKRETRPILKAVRGTALSDVGRVEQALRDIGAMAARTVAAQKALEKTYADARGC